MLKEDDVFTIQDILNRKTGCTVCPQYLGRQVRLKNLRYEYIGKPLAMYFINGGNVNTDVIKTH